MSTVTKLNPRSEEKIASFSVDPCAGPTPTATLAECQRTGVTPAQYGNITQCPAAQCAVLTGGNPLVEPETADTITFGFTLNPTALPDFTMSLDWYEIEVDGIIGNIPLNTIYNGCASGTNPEYCASVVRSPFGGLFGQTIAGGGYIVGTNANVAKAQTTKASKLLRPVSPK